MKRWRFEDKALRKMYEEYKNNSKTFEKTDMSYREFKKWAEHYANSLIQKVKKEVEDEKTVG